MTKANILSTQQWVEGRFETVHADATDATTCPEVNLDSRDVGEGTFRLVLTDEEFVVLDTSEEVVLVDPTTMYAAAERLAAARAELGRAVEQAKDAARQHVYAGGAEAEAARLVGLDRMTVRKALGK